MSMVHNGFLKRAQDPVAVPEDFLMFDAEVMQERTRKRASIKRKLRQALAAGFGNLAGRSAGGSG